MEQDRRQKHERDKMPQAVNASANNNAQEMFARDVNNMRRYYGEFAPALLHTEYAKEMWALFEEGNLTPNSRLTGIFEDANVSADVDAVLEEIQAVMQEEQERQERIREANED